MWEGGGTLAILSLYGGISFLQKSSRHQAAVFLNMAVNYWFLPNNVLFHSKFMSEIF